MNSLFLISLLLNIFLVYIIIAKSPMKLEGAMPWVDLYSDDADATLKFLYEKLGIEVSATSKENNIDYRIIKAKKGLMPFAGVMQIDEQHRNEGLKPHAAIYLTVKNYDEMHKKFIDSGAISIVENMMIKNMKFGIYIIPGGLDIGIVEFNVKK